jgi:hypothetical protein
MTRALVLAVCLLLLAACGAAEPTAAERGYAEALRALREGRPRDAAAAAEEAAREDAAAFAPRRDFVRGNVAFAASEAAEAEAEKPDAPPDALEVALAHAEDAVAHWGRAASSRDDWPSARRNLERGLLRLAALRAKQRSRSAKPPEERPPPPEATPPTPERRERDKDPATVDLETKELRPEDVARLWQVLAQKEREKRAARRAARAADPAAAERDW